MSSKLTVHLSTYPDRVFDLLEKMQPGLIKVYNQSSEMNIDMIKRVCPNIVIAYRQYTNLDYHNSTADMFFAELQDTFNKLRGRGILWEGLNEPVVSTVEEAQMLNSWYVRFAEIMHANGELAAGFSWSTGNPVNIALVAPHVAQAAAACDVHAFHEYYNTIYGGNDWARYRLFEEALPASSRKPVIITEAGLDNNGDPYSGGYRGKISYQQYLDVLKQYDALLMQDPYVLGATIYQWGDWSWPSFELQPMIDLLVNHIASVGHGEVTPKPWPIPQFGSVTPTYSFSASPQSIAAGQASTLTWNVQGAKQVYLDGAVVNATGTRAVTPTQTTTYTLHIVLTDNTSQDLPVTITVITQATYSFSITPQTVTRGQSALLKWDADGVKSIYVDGQGVVGHGTQVVSPTTTTTYTCRVVLTDNSEDILTATLTVQEPVTTPVLDWDARLDTLKVSVAQASVSPAWRLVAAKYRDVNESNGKQEVFFKVLREDGSPMPGCRFVVDWQGRAGGDDPAFAMTDGNGECSVPLWVAFNPQTQTGIYFAHVHNQPSDVVNGLGLPNNQKVSFVLTFQSKSDVVTPPPSPTYSFTVNPTTITAGQSAALAWNVTGASSVTLGGAAVAMSGSQTVTPAQTTTYTLHIVLNDGTTKDLSVTITVNASVPGSFEWDVRLDALGVAVTQTTTSPAWQLTAAKYKDVNESAGEHHVHIKAMRADGSPASNVRFVVDWQGRDRSDAPAIITTDASGNANCPLWAGFNLANKNGIYFVTSKDQPGDTVGGLGLPNNQQVSFVLTYQWGSDTPSPTPTFSFSATPASISAGQFATLAWQVTGANSVTLDGTTVAASGTQTVTPTQTRTYTLHMVLNDGTTKDLTATVTVTPVTPQPTYSFTANPQLVVVGQSSLLTWSVTNAKSVTLDGVSVASSGMLTVTPAQTKTYTLRITSNDNTTQDSNVTVTVAGQLPSGATRPPTVVLSAENIAHLKTFPRPANDNGRGLHYNIDLRDATNVRTISHLQSIGVKWTMVYAQDELQAGRVAKTCWTAGIMPIIRIGKRVDEYFDPMAYVNQLKANGTPLYIQIYNEPGDDREWRTWPGATNWARIFAGRWANAAIQIADAGGHPGLQILGREEFDAAVDAVQANNRADIWQHAFFSLHNYGANHPPAYPYDDRNQQDHPGATILDDDISILSFLEIATWMKERIGFVLPIIGGEGGWEFGSNEDNRYPKCEQPYHAQYHKEAFDWFRTRVISNGEPLPDYLFSVAPWIEGGWGADDWWGGPLGDKTETIQAIQAIPAFVRKFSWDDPYPPLVWDVRLDTLGVNVERAVSNPAWRLVSAIYQDETESGLNHNVYFKALNADGTPAANVTFAIDFIGRNPSEPVPTATTDENGETNSPIWATMHPELKDGPYFAFVQNEASDTVRGMGLPANRHVNFLLTYQKMA